MPHVSWSRRSIQDLARLYAFLAEQSPDAAERAVVAIRSSIAPLQASPGIGRPVDGLRPDIRERVIKFGKSAYVARYRFDGNAVVVLALRHGREAGF